MPSERDDLTEYWLVRTAVRDAIWDVIGTVMTVILVGVLLLFGVATVSSGFLEGGATTGLIVGSFGLVLIAAAIVLFLREFRLFPFD